MSNPSAPSAQSTKADKFAVPAIPPFKGASKAPINYAAAAGSKSKPSPAAVNGKDATATVIGSTAGTAPAAQAISAIGGASSASTSASGLARKQSVKVDAVNVAPASAADAKAGAGGEWPPSPPCPGRDDFVRPVRVSHTADQPTMLW